MITVVLLAVALSLPSSAHAETIEQARQITMDTAWEVWTNATHRS